MKYAKTCFVVGLMMALAVGALAAETKKMQRRLLLPLCMLLVP